MPEKPVSYTHLGVARAQLDVDGEPPQGNGLVVRVKLVRLKVRGIVEQHPLRIFLFDFIVLPGHVDRGAGHLLQEMCIRDRRKGGYEMRMQEYEFWFVVGSQFLHGPEVLETVAARAAEMAEKMNASGNLPYRLVYKLTAKTNQEIAQEMCIRDSQAEPGVCLENMDLLRPETKDVKALGDGGMGLI